MTRMVAVVEEPESILKLSKLYPEDKFISFTKGHEWARKKFDEDDAKRYSEFDIVIIQKNRKEADEIRKMILKYANKDIVLVRYLYDGHIEKIGDFQVVKVSESFHFHEIYHAEYPWLKGYEMASQMIESQTQKR